MLRLYLPVAGFVLGVVLLVLVWAWLALEMLGVIQ